MKILGIHLGVTLACFVMCGALFVLAVSLLVGRYVNHDLDFLLTEVSSNLEQRLQYMEEVIYDVRDSDEMMQFLTQSGEQAANEADSPDMGKVIDISGQRNQAGRGGPLVESVYLFRSDGKYLSEFYYTLVYSEISENDRGMQAVWQEYIDAGTNEPGFHGSFFQDESGVYMLYPVLDDDMNEQGTIIFQVNIDAVREIMSELNSYEDAKWVLYTEDHVIAGEHNISDVDGFIESAGRKQGAEPYISRVDGTPYRVYTSELCVCLYVSAGIPENQAAVVLYNSLNLYIAGIIVILLAGMGAFTFFTVRLTQPIKEVAEKLRQVQTEGFDTKLPDYSNKEFHEVSQTFNQMTEHINTLIKQVYEKQLTIKEMELKFFQSQMNPHFMFNVLNAIALQAKIDGNEEICELISTFAKLIQAKIYRSDTEKVKISQELEYVKYYLMIQQFRYGEGLSWSVETEDEGILDMKIPKLCIQLLVENAVVHGLEPKTGAGRVDIRIKRADDSIYIEVSDDGVGFDADGEVALPIESGPTDEKHNHVGLNNVNHIIQLMYGEEYGVKIYSTRGKGTSVRVYIPCD